MKGPCQCLQSYMSEIFTAWFKAESLIRLFCTADSNLFYIDASFFSLQLHNRFDRAAGEVLSSILYILTKQPHLPDSSTEHMLVYSLVPYISTCHVRKQHSKAANAPHRQQLEHRNKPPFPFSIISSPLPSSEGSLLISA